MLMVLAVALILVVTQSRACQAIALLALAWNIVFNIKGKQRLVLLLITALAVGTVAGTDNTISRRFKALTAEENPDRFSDYPDDRLHFGTPIGR